MRRPEPVSHLDERIAERERAARRTWWRRTALWILVGGGVGGIVWGVFFSPLFALRAEHVAVSAEGNVDLPAVQSLVDARLGTPLPRLNTSSLSAELEAVPTVFDAQVERVWPAGLTVHVVARTPVAAVPWDDGFHLFDSYGVEVGVVGEAPAGIPVVNVPLGDDTSLLLADIGAVMGSLPADFRAQVFTVSAVTRDAIEFQLSNGATVRWGSNSENELKLAVLDTLLQQVQAGLYDVSSPRAPITE